MTPELTALLAEAAAALRAGEVVAFPTDTVYGLAVDPDRPGATARLFALKGRPDTVALPVLVGDRAQAQTLAGPDGLPPLARRLADRFWPGPLTMVVPRAADLDWDLGGDDATIGIREPADPLARALCLAVGPLATTSANLHGDEPLTTAAAVRAAFPVGIAVVVDGGPCAGQPSTVVDATGAEPVCLRAGGVPWEGILAIVADR